LYFLHLVRSFRDTVNTNMTTFTIFALLFVCAVGEVSGYCYNDWGACQSACTVASSCRVASCGYRCYDTVAVAVPVVQRVVVTPARWTGFSGWSACSASCGTGTQTRTRTCIPGSYGATCSGAATQTRSCYAGACRRVVTTELRYVGGVVGGGCVDVSGSCGAWSGAGMCTSYSGYMATSCCQSCSGLISAYIKEKPEHVKWTPEKYVEVMNAELKSKK